MFVRIQWMVCMFSDVHGTKPTRAQLQDKTCNSRHNCGGPRKVRSPGTLSTKTGISHGILDASITVFFLGEGAVQHSCLSTESIFIFFRTRLHVQRSNWSQQRMLQDSKCADWWSCGTGPLTSMSRSFLDNNWRRWLDSLVRLSRSA